LQLVLATVVARLALELVSDHVLRQAHRDVWLLPLWDIVSFAIFVASFWSSRVTWRGFHFEVDSDGLLSAVQDERVSD
jgi:ceramide glucosyltransferase